MTDPAARCDCSRCRAHDAGHRGRVFTPREFTEIIGAVNEPPPVDLPAELVELGIELDAAQGNYDIAKCLLEDAHANWVGLPERDPAKAVAESAFEAAKDELHREGRRVSAARMAYNAASTRITTQRDFDEYQATVAAQAAAKEAERVARLAAAPSAGVLAKLRQRVTR